MIRFFFIKHCIISLAIALVQYKYIINERLDFDYVKEHEKELLWIVLNYFNEWENFITAADIDKNAARNKEVGRRWNKESEEKIISRIKFLKKLNIPLASGYAQKNYRILFKSAIRCFDSWGNAITAAGLDYSEIKLYEDWGKQKVISKIQNLKARNIPLNPQYIIDKYKRLFNAAIRHFDSWGNAIIAAGLDYSEIKLYEDRDKQKVITKILDLKARNISLNSSYIQTSYAYLYGMACYYFDSWENAITAAGLDYSEIKLYEDWDKKEVIINILDLKARNIPLNSLYIQKNYAHLYGAACYYFDSWENAITAAGLDYSEIKLEEDWDRQGVIDEILCLNEYGLPLNPECIKRVYPALYKAGIRHFGSWGSAVEAAGLSYIGECINVNSITRLRLEVTKEKITEIQENFSNKRSVT